MSPPFGSWAPLCGSPLGDSASLDTASPFPECNLFFRELLKVNDPPALTRLFPFRSQYNISSESSVEDLVTIQAVREAGVGVGVRCRVGRAGVDGQYGDIAQIVASSLSFFFMMYIIWKTSRRRAAVGRVEINFLFTIYAVMLPIQVLTLGSVLEQGSTAITVLSAIHVALIAAMFWVLLGNALVATQVVEDGTPSFIVPLTIVFLLILGITVYISLDTAFGISSVFLLENGSQQLQNLKNVALFVLGLVWPLFCVTAYTAIMIYVVRIMLQETRPLLWFLSAFATFAISQVILMLTSQPLCLKSNGHLTSGFLATILETLSIYLLFLGWKSITEDDWQEPYTNPNEPHAI